MDRNLKAQFFPFRAYKLGELLNLFDGVDCSSAYTITVTHGFIPNFITQCSPRPHRGTAEQFPYTLFGDFGELLVYFILTCNGYSVTKPTPDHGVDFLAEKGTERLAIQVKFRSNLEHEFNLVDDNIEAWFHEPEGRKIKSCITAMMTGSIVYADTTEDVKQYFPGIGEDIGYWIWENTPDKNGVVKTNIDGKIVKIDFKLSHSRPQLTNADVLRTSIEKKLIDKISTHSIRVEGLKGMQWEAGPKSVGLQETLSPIKTEEFSQSVRITPANTMFVQPDRVELKFGICFTASGYYYKKGMDDKYMPATNEPTGQDFLKILCDNETQVANVSSYLKSKLYIVYVMHIIGKAFNNFALARLPFLGRDKFWTDAELYQHFELTEEEINYVESFQIK